MMYARATVSRTDRVSRTPKLAVLCTCLMLGIASGALTSCGPEQVSTTATADFAYGLTAMGAEAFVAKAEARTGRPVLVNAMISATDARAGSISL